MDQHETKVIFLIIFLTSSSSKTSVSGQFAYFDRNYRYYDDFPIRILNARQFQNVRFGHQNPIFIAPTLAPQITSFEFEEIPREPPVIRPFYEPSWTTTPRTLSPFMAAMHSCPNGYVKSWAGGQEGCIRRQEPGGPRWSQLITTRPTSRPTPFAGNYRTVTKYFCPVGHIAVRPTGQCVPTTTKWPPTGYHSVVDPITVTTPREPRRMKTTVRYGHQNPILVAPTLPPSRPTEISPTFQNTFPTAKTDGWSEVQWTSSTPNAVLNPCDLGSANHRLDPKTNRCFALGSAEPCGGLERNLAFYALHNDHKYGICDCNLDSSRPLVYHRETDTCYFIYQQAYCEEDQQWLAINNRGVPSCTHNPCYEYGQKVLKWDWKRNSNATYMNTDGIIPLFEVEKCVPLGQICHRLPNGTLAFAEPTDPSTNFSQYLTVVTFHPGGLEPTCTRRSTQTLPTNNILPRRCRPGSKSNILGHCQATLMHGESRNPFSDRLISNSKFDASANYTVSGSSSVKATNLICLMIFFLH